MNFFFNNFKIFYPQHKEINEFFNYLPILGAKISEKNPVLKLILSSDNSADLNLFLNVWLVISAKMFKMHILLILN